MNLGLPTGGATGGDRPFGGAIDRSIASSTSSRCLRATLDNRIGRAFGLLPHDRVLSSVHTLRSIRWHHEDGGTRLGVCAFTFSGCSGCRDMCFSLTEASQGIDSVGAQLTTDDSSVV